METQSKTVHIEKENSAGEKVKMTPAFFFVSLGLLVTLITSVVSLLNLVFEALNKRFPDVLNANYTYGYSTYEYENMRMALATLIIFFPVFVVLSYFWKKFIVAGLSKVDDVLRKWLTYLVLFLSSLVVIIDLVTLVKYFVSGEITTRFILKVASALLVALVVGVYYMLVLKNKNTRGVEIAFTLTSSVIVLFAIIWSFTVMGSPMKQRLLRLDDRRVTDLQSIQWAVINYWQQKEKLPESFDDLKDPLSSFVIPPDPEFEKGKVYEYNKIANEKNELTFELCATFSEDMPKGWREYSNGGGVVMPMYSEKSVDMAYPYPGGGMNESWEHSVGRTCFSRTIDKDIYPPFKDN